MTSLDDCKDSFGAIGRSEIPLYLSDHRDALLAGPELPGDVWNIRCFQRICGDTKGDARVLRRRWHDELKCSGELSPRARVHQFDVTYAYSPRMCESHAFGSCLFRRESGIWQCCPPREGIEWRGRFCPVADHLCGFA